MIAADAFVEQARGHGFGLWTGVPCSCLKPFINYVIDDPTLHYVAAANEGDAVAVAAGAELAGTPAVAMFQNSGLGNAVNPLTSLTWPFRIPLLLIVTLRGEPGGAPDEPQHELMGRITGDLLNSLQIPWSWFPRETGEIGPTLDAVMSRLRVARRPYALVMRQGSVAPWPLRSGLAVRPRQAVGDALPPVAAATRSEMLAGVLTATGPEDAVIATTGFTSRELYALDDRASHFYMVGSMGCAASIGLGIATVQPQRRVIVLDGDGALLMRLGALATLGYYRPPRFAHVVLDNGVHESTGGQSTVSPSLDLCAMARACGFPRALTAADPITLVNALEGPDPGPLFIRAAIRRGAPEDLPRPRETPAELAARFRRHLETRLAGSTPPA
jgi:phosphonopyruvate decarboxylase